MELKDFEGKYIYVKLISDRVYTGLVETVTYMGQDPQGVDLWLFSIRDKFMAIVCFTNKEIKFIEEEPLRRR